jgi:hypothetical protein
MEHSRLAKVHSFKLLISMKFNLHMLFLCSVEDFIVMRFIAPAFPTVFVTPLLVVF